MSATRVTLKGVDSTVEDGNVEVSCPVCRGVGICVTKEEWDAWASNKKMITARTETGNSGKLYHPSIHHILHDVQSPSHFRLIADTYPLPIK